jgi:hypothetical protein
VCVQNDFEPSSLSFSLLGLQNAICLLGLASLRSRCRTWFPGHWEGLVKTAIVSNFDTRLRSLLHALKCDDWFDAVVVSAEVSFHFWINPSYGIFLYLPNMYLILNCILLLILYNELFFLDPWGTGCSRRKKPNNILEGKILSRSWIIHSSHHQELPLHRPYRATKHSDHKTQADLASSEGDRSREQAVAE